MLPSSCSGNVGKATYIEPIDVLVPILPSDGLVGDVWCLGVVFGVAVGLSGAGGSGWLRDELRIDGGLASGGLVRRHADFGGVRDSEGVMVVEDLMERGRHQK